MGAHAAAGRGPVRPGRPARLRRGASRHEHAWLTPSPVLAVVGAGPKALAVAVKHAALRAAGHAVPDLVILDPAGVAAHWDGRAGYTDGDQRLGTPPLKDLGYPYPASWGTSSAAVNEHACRYSWPTFLATTHRYGDWVDRGTLHPPHATWAQYLRWAADRLDLAPLPLDVTGICIADARWNLRTSDGVTLAADGLAREQFSSG